MKRIFLLFSLLMMICLLLTSCAMAKLEDKNSLVNQGVTSEEALQEPNAIADETGKADATNTTSDLAVRKMIKDMTLDIQTKSFDTFISSLQKEIGKNGGYIESSSIDGNNNAYDSNRYATVVARIPAGKLDLFSNKVAALGNVTKRAENVKDVTKEYIDTESRIKALRTEQDSLLALLKKATNLNDIVTIQDRLTKVRSDLESYESQLRTYKDLVSYSTVTMNISEVERVTVVKQGAWKQISSKFMNNLTDIGNGFKNLFIWFAGSLPYLILFGLIVFIIVLILVKSAKKSRARFITPATPSKIVIESKEEE